jgi:hypothetical protein
MGSKNGRLAPDWAALTKQPGVPSSVRVRLRVLTPAGRAIGRRPRASYPPSSSLTAFSILCAEWLCTQDRWNPEVAIIIGAAARLHQTTVGSSHDGAHPDNSTLRKGAVRPHIGFVGGNLLHVAPYGPWQLASVRDATSLKKKKTPL